MTRVRLSPDDRRGVIITAARRLVEEAGSLAVLTHGGVAARCVLPTSIKTVKHYFPTRADLVRAVEAKGTE